MDKLISLPVIVSSFLLCVLYVNGENKYSAEANSAGKYFPLEPEVNVRTLEKPFRMAKLNLLWKKAQVVSIPIPKPQNLII